MCIDNIELFFFIWFFQERNEDGVRENHRLSLNHRRHDLYNLHDCHRKYLHIHERDQCFHDDSRSPNKRWELV